MPYEGRPEPSERELAHVRQLFLLVDAALERSADRFKKYEKWRQAYAGHLAGENSGQVRSNMIYANIAAMMPQVYAKNPDISFSPSQAVDPKRYELTKKFAETGETVVSQQLRDAFMKKRAKASVRSAMTCSLGWWKVSFQEDRRTDPVISNRINDIADNLDRIRSLTLQIKGEGRAVDDSTLAEQAELEQQLKALQELPEITVARGITIDAPLAEDVIVLDRTVRSFDEYTRSDKIAHRVWMSEATFLDTFGYKPECATRYAELSVDASGKSPEAGTGFYCVFEIWDKSAGTVYTLAKGEKGYVRPPYVPQKVGRRWYPFFGLGFNLVDGRFEPLSDVELLTALADEYNTTRDELVKHRKMNVPVRLAKKGGNLTDEDVQRIQNRQTDDVIFINGTPGRPLGDDIAILETKPIDAGNYDTTPIRADMEQILGGGDAARGTITKAKTATEAEIMAMGLRSRTEERQDAIEDMLGEVAQYVFEVCLRELSVEEVIRIAGQEAVWPQMSIDEAMSHVSVEIKAGTSGKPNKLQEQDRWLQLLPIVEKAMLTVVEMRSAGQIDMADAITELLRETLHRFDERIDVDNFIPPAQGSVELEDMSQDQLKAGLMQAQVMIQQLQEQLQLAMDEEGKAERADARKLDHEQQKQQMASDQKRQEQAMLPMPEPVEQPDPMEVIKPVVEVLEAKMDGLQQLVDYIGQQSLKPEEPDMTDPEDTAEAQALAQIAQQQDAVLQALAALAQQVAKPKTRKVEIRTPSGQVYTGESMEQ